MAEVHTTTPTVHLDPALVGQGTNVTVVRDGPWSVLHYRVDGAAGSWFAAWQPLPKASPSVEWKALFRIELKGTKSTPQAALVLAPSLLLESPDGVGLDAGALKYVSKKQGMNVTITDGAANGWLKREAKAGNYVGFVTVIGSSAPWAFSGTITLKDGSGPETVPSLTTLGSGFKTLGTPNHTSDGVPFATDLTTFAAKTPLPGWTHIQLTSGNVVKASQDVTLPGGASFHEDGNGRLQRTGYGILAGKADQVSVTIHAVGGRYDPSGFFVPVPPSSLPAAWGPKPYFLDAASMG